MYGEAVEDALKALQAKQPDAKIDDVFEGMTIV